MNAEPAHLHDDTAALLDMLERVDLLAAVRWIEEEIGVTEIERYVADQPCVDETQRDRLRATMHSIVARSESLPGRHLARELTAAMAMRVAPIEWREPDETPGRRTPHWPTGCRAIDELSEGGYGMTVIAGAPKVGKSLLALSSAIEAARAGWSVVYCNAEMSPDHFLRRIRNYVGGKFDDALVENLHLAHVGPGVTIEAMCAEIRERALDDETERLLIVVDSINRIVDFGATDGNEAGYWRLLRDWSAWAMNARRSTEGAISWLIVSELNQRGDVKGRNLEYTADLVVRMAASQLDPEVVEFDVPYSRATRAAQIGPLFRIYNEGRFIRADEQ